MRKTMKIEYESPKISEVNLLVVDFMVDLLDSDLGDPNVFGGEDDDDILGEV